MQSGHSQELSNIRLSSLSGSGESALWVSAQQALLSTCLSAAALWLPAVASVELQLLWRYRAKASMLSSWRRTSALRLANRVMG